MESSSQDSKRSCFLRWMNFQEQHLTELLHALDHNNADGDENDRNAYLSQLVDKMIRHFQDCAGERAGLARADVSPYFSPTWCSSLEGSMMWVGGCRPSIFIKLVLALSGWEFVSCLEEYLQGSSIGGLGELSASQLPSINSLQQETIREEDKLNMKQAGLQEEIADEPIAIIVKELQAHGEASGEADQALDTIGASLTGVLEEADNLRINTLKRLTGILTPIQVVDFLAAAKKLHLCFHAWVGGGMKRMGGTELVVCVYCV